ncbi:MAG TPA: hypothetical protein VFJ57_00240 [Solirubrobacterales bacterium]|nr:hypothetical protein [Solirubrobacterales bacterium]
MALSGHAFAQDPEAGLAEAREKAATARGEIPSLESAAEPVEARFEKATGDAAPIRAELRTASKRVAAIERSLRNQHQMAVATVQRVEEEREEASDEHSESVRAGIGLGIAALVLALIALTWDLFRASAAVAYLARMDLGQAIGLCVGGGLLAVIVGVALSSTDGIAGAIGYAAIALGFALPIAFVVARHSAEVQRGRATPHLRRERLPARATKALGGVFGALFLLCLGTAVFAGEAKSGDASAQVRASATNQALSSPALVAAESDASKLAARARAVLAVVHQRQGDLRVAKRRLGRAHARLVAAEEDERHFTQRLASIEERELREQEREEQEAQKLAEVEEREYEEALQEEEELAAEECDPNYSGCLDPNAVDYDCEGGSGDGPLYTGTVEVTGVDYYGLDDDGDGIGCDP